MGADRSSGGAIGRRPGAVFDICTVVVGPAAAKFRQKTDCRAAHTDARRFRRSGSSSASSAASRPGHTTVRAGRRDGAVPPNRAFRARQFFVVDCSGPGHSSASGPRDPRAANAASGAACCHLCSRRPGRKRSCSPVSRTGVHALA